MKRSKRIFALLGVLAVVCVAAFAAVKYQQRQERIKTSGAVILELPVDSVTALSWENEDAALSFHRDETWHYDGDEAFPVDGEKIGALLEQFEAFTAAFVIEDVDDYGQYGLDDPVCTVALETAEQSYEILLGGFSQMDQQRYVSMGDGNVYLMKVDPLDSFDAVLSDLIAHDQVPALEDVTQIQFSGAQDYTVTYEADSGKSCRADDVYFTRRSGKEKPLDTDRVDTYLDDIRYLNLTDYVTYNATEEELRRYGLDEPELTVSVDYTGQTEDGEEQTDTFVLHISRDPEQRAAQEQEAEDADGEEEITAYARVGQSPIVYQIFGDDYAALMAAGYDDLRHQALLTADFADVTQLDITLEGSVYTVAAQGQDEDRVWLYQEEELEIGDLQSALEKLTADSFTEEQPTGKEEIRLTVRLDNQNFPEVDIALYRYDGTSCLAVVDGEPTALVSRSRVVALIEAVHAIVL